MVTAAEMAEGVQAMCDRLEKQWRQEAVRRSRGISTTRVYPKQEFLEALELGEDAWAAMKASGLRHRKAGNRIFITGAAFARWIDSQDESQGA